jgi:hypothetical protein
MHIDEIREARNRQPFQPFSLRLADGREIPVQHPEFIAVSRRRVAVFDAEERLSIPEPLLIVSLEFPAGTSLPPPWRENGAAGEG